MITANKCLYDEKYTDDVQCVFSFHKTPELFRFVKNKHMCYHCAIPDRPSTSEFKTILIPAIITILMFLLACGNLVCVLFTCRCRL